MVIQIKITGIKEVQQVMKRYAEKLPESGRAGTWNFTQQLAKALREAAPRGFSGRMKSKAGTYAQKLDKNKYVIKMPIYTKYLEKGTQPSQPVSPTRHPRFAGWARMHGINPWALGIYAHSKGTKAHPFTQAVIQSELTKLKKTVEKKINNSIKRNGGR